MADTHHTINIHVTVAEGGNATIHLPTHYGDVVAIAGSDGEISNVGQNQPLLADSRSVIERAWTFMKKAAKWIANSFGGGS